MGGLGVIKLPLLRRGKAVEILALPVRHGYSSMASKWGAGRGYAPAARAVKTA
jgi:hypothetical protein